jgi:hypothetical protein
LVGQATLTMITNGPSLVMGLPQPGPILLPEIIGRRGGQYAGGGRRLRDGVHDLGGVWHSSALFRDCEGSRWPLADVGEHYV